jgi:hypothetical protein
MKTEEVQKHVKKAGYREPVISYVWHSSCANNRNVGDQVTPYLYEKITGNKINYIHPSKTDKDVCLATGSIIQHKHVKYGNTIIWGSGVMLENIPEFSCRKVYCVRGPLTRKILLGYNIDCPRIYGDPALLLPRFYNPSRLINKKKNRIGYIFHHSQYELSCSLSLPNNCIVIDVTLPVEQFVDKILSCDYTMSSSLHGVVISHAYGVKSMPFFIKEKPLYEGFFKFDDYFASVGIWDFERFYMDEIKRLNCEALVKIIEDFPNPDFPVEVPGLYESCPFVNTEFPANRETSLSRSLHKAFRAIVKTLGVKDPVNK